MNSHRGPLTSLTSQLNYINKLLSIFHGPEPLLLCAFLKDSFSGLRFTSLSVPEIKVLLPPSPPISRLFYLPHISLTEHLCLCLPCSCGNVYHFLSASDDLSHFASPQGCRPLNANLAALSVPRTHRRNTVVRTETVITTLRRTRKLFHRLHFFSVHLSWIFLQYLGEYWWWVLKLRYVRASLVFKVCQKIFFLSCVYSHLLFKLLFLAVLLSLTLSLTFFFFSFSLTF